MRRIVFVVFMLCSVWRIHVFAQARNPTELCTLQGHVVDALTGEPLRKVRLILRDLGANSTPSDTATDDSGGFAMKDIEPGRYRLSAERNGYLRQEYGARLQNSTGTILTLSAGQRLSDLVLKLTPFGVIAGRVVDEDSEPVPGAQITVF